MDGLFHLDAEVVQTLERVTARRQDEHQRLDVGAVVVDLGQVEPRRVDEFGP